MTAKLRQTRLATKGADLKADLDYWSAKRTTALELGDTAQDVPFFEELAGPDGMSFTLLPNANQNNDLVARAADWLLRRRDVVTMRVLRIEQELTRLHGEVQLG